MKGLIACDIDGTITVDHHHLEPDVAKYFTQLSQEGWRFVFITGRTFSWGYPVLQSLKFSYYYCVQNGAIIVEMPGRNMLAKTCLDRRIFSEMDRICTGEKTDYVVYTGFENADVCYYRPKFFSPELLGYVEKRVQILQEKWIPLESFDQLPVEDFPSVKCFGDLESAIRIMTKIEKLGLHAPFIKDPVNPNVYIVQATHKDATKGHALQIVKKHLQFEGTTIAAGDDYNDRNMLQVADIRIVMSTAPKDLHEEADLIAPPASEKGIIVGLKEAIKLCK